jgi:trigger factor
MTATQERKNKVQLTDAGPSLKRIAIEVPVEVVEEKLRTSIDALAANASMPGFRPGRVPRQLVEKRFGPAVRKDAKQELASNAFREAIEELRLKIVGDPSGGNLDKVEVHEGKPFAFELEVEVLPDFELPNLEGVALKRPMLEVTDQMINDEVTKLCINEGSLESREAAEAGDYCTGHAVMTGPDGQEFYNLQGAVIQAPTADKNGRGMMLGIMVDDFATQLGSPKPGDSITVRATGPANHEVEGIRNAALVMTFKIERIDRIIPAKVEDVVKLVGMESEDAMRSALRERMGVNVQIQQQAALHNQVMKHLLDSTKIDLPQRITSQQASRTLERRRMELMYRGVDPHKIEEHMAELRQASAAAATRELKTFFILFRAAETLGIGVSQNEVSNRIAQLAFQRNTRPDVLAQELRRTNQLGTVVQQIRDHKTLDSIVSRAVITEVPAAELAALAKG